MKKIVHRRIDSSKTKSPGSDRPVSGFGYTIIPSDIERAQYINLVYRTGRVMIVTNDNNVVSNVLVSNEILPNLQFPQKPGEYGQVVSWNTVPAKNQVFITGTYNKPGQFSSCLEHTDIKEYSVGKNTVIRGVDKVGPRYLISVDSDSQKTATAQFQAKSTGGVARIVLKGDGSVNINADSYLKSLCNKLYHVEVSTDQQTKKSLKIDAKQGLSYEDQAGTQVEIKDDKVIHHQGTSPLMLGDKSVDLLRNFINEVARITVTAQGSPSSPPINALALQSYANQLNELLSQHSYIK